MGPKVGVPCYFNVSWYKVNKWKARLKQTHHWQAANHLLRRQLILIEPGK